MGNRKLAEKMILDFCKQVEPTGYNVKVFQEIFKDMSDKDFDRFMKGLKDKTMFLPLFKPLNEAEGLTIESVLKTAEKYKLEFFEKLIFTNKETGFSYKTPIDYLVVDMPYRRQSQTLIKKISVPDNNNTIDELTYQPTGESKGAKISYPELQVLIGMGLDNSLNELMRFRGGDRNGFSAYNAMFLRYGSANLKTLNNFSSGVESTKTLKVYLSALHLSNTI